MLAERDRADPVVVGFGLLEEFDPVAALAVFEEILAANPRSLPAQAGRTCALWMTRRADEANESLTRLFPAGEDVVEAHLARGLVALGMRDDMALFDSESSAYGQDLDVAEAAFGRARSLRPDSVSAIRGQAAVLRARRHVAEARALLDGAIEDVGSSSGLLIERAITYWDEGRIEEGLPDLERAWELASDGVRVEATLLLRDFYVRLDRSTQATALLEALRERGHGSPEIFEAEAWLHLERLKRLTDPSQRAEARAAARVAFGETLAMLPGHVGALSGLAWIVRDEQGTEQAIGYILSAHDVDPRSPQLNTTLGWLLCESYVPADLEHALACMNNALVEAPALITAWSGIVRVHTYLGDLDSAARRWRAMQHSFPDHPATLRDGSHLAIRRREPMRALDLALRALAINPYEVSGPVQVASARKELGDFSGASEPDDLLDQAIRRWPGDTSLRWAAMQRAAGEDRFAEALAICDTIAALDPVDEWIAAERRELVARRRKHPLYRLRGAAIDREALLNAQIPPDILAGLSEHVGSQEETYARVRLRPWYWRRARVRAAQPIAEDAVGLLIIVPLLLASLVLPWFVDYISHGGVWWGIGQTVIAIVVYVIYAEVFSVAKRWPRSVLVFAAIIVSLWAVLTNGDAQRFARAGIVLPTVVAVLALALFEIVDYVARSHEGRIDALHADARMIVELVVLLQILDVPAQEWNRHYRREIADQIALIARLQGTAIASEWLGKGVAADISRHARSHGLRVAAQIRTLRLSLVSWNTTGAAELRKDVRALLAIACRGEWGRLRTSDPEHVPSLFWPRVRHTAAVLIIVGIIAFGVFLVDASRSNASGPPEALAVLVALLGAATTLFAPLMQPLFGRWHATHDDAPTSRPAASPRG